MKISGNMVQNAGGPPQRTWARILKDYNCELDSLDALAGYFRVDPWQLLVPDMNTTPSPYVKQGKPLTPKQEQFLEEFEHADPETKKLILRLLSARRRK